MGDGDHCKKWRMRTPQPRWKRFLGIVLTRAHMCTDKHTHATQATGTAFAQLEKGSLDGAMKTLVALKGVGPGVCACVWRGGDDSDGGGDVTMNMRV